MFSLSETHLMALSIMLLGLGIALTGQASTVGFLLVSTLVMSIGFHLFKLDKEALPPRCRVIFRRRYWLYYTLAFLMGGRRHIFTTFAIFLLVKEHGISVQTAALLYFVNSLVKPMPTSGSGSL